MMASQQDNFLDREVWIASDTVPSNLDKLLYNCEHLRKVCHQNNVKAKNDFCQNIGIESNTNTARTHLQRFSSEYVGTLLCTTDRPELKRQRLSVSSGKLSTETLKRSIDDVWKICTYDHMISGTAAKPIFGDGVPGSEDNYGLPIRSKEHNRKVAFEENTESTYIQAEGDVRKVWIEVKTTPDKTHEPSEIGKNTQGNMDQATIPYPLNREHFRNIFETSGYSVGTQTHQKCEERIVWTEINTTPEYSRVNNDLDLKEYHTIHQPSIGCEENTRHMFFKTNVDDTDTHMRQEEDLREVWIEVDRPTKRNEDQSIIELPITYEHHTRNVFFGEITELTHL